ncbi:antigen peptide transporter 1-like [Myxocyprinus asiaticus]|uniref:antigen peptide transporter 1-like n=1 Tax=Myxocyprinus asiaticus TaxID=70543 RepID=UPI002222A1A9|nr:antigen peptide transporter 1-like [Myxocyprinus asiaticus]
MVQELEMKDMMAIPLFAVLVLYVEACAVMCIGALQLSASFINNTFITLWAGGLIRTCLLLFFAFTYSGSPSWMRGVEGVQTAAVHGLLYPLYITILWACGRSTVELVWGWHTWQGKLSAQVLDSLVKANDVATETFSSIKTVRSSFANENGESERYRKCLEETYALNKVKAAAYAASTWTNSMSSLALKVSILYYGGRLVTGSDVSSGDLVSFLLYELQFTSAVEVLMSNWPHVKKAVGASEKIFEYVDHKPDIPPDGSLAPQALKGHVHFNNITFAYPKTPDTNVLKNVSLELKAGQITALVGPSGAGKSTFVSLLERFYQLHNGEILLDHKPLLSYKDQYLHETVILLYSSDQRVYSALRKDTRKCTVLLISNGLSGVENADHIFFLREGEVAEQGNHNELLAKNGFYAEFVKQQNVSISRKTEDATNTDP